MNNVTNGLNHELGEITLPPREYAAFQKMDCKCTVIHHGSALLLRPDTNSYIAVFGETNDV